MAPHGAGKVQKNFLNLTVIRPKNYNILFFFCKDYFKTIYILFLFSPRATETKTPIKLKTLNTKKIF